jgi:PAS domain S-box-containing protein
MVANASLQYVLNRLPIGMVMLDREQRVVSYSGTVAQIFGVERIRELLGRRIGDMHPGPAQDKIEWLLQQSADESSPTFASMLINVPETILQLRLVRLNDAGGLCGYCLVLYDITELTTLAPAEPAAPDEPAMIRRLVKLPVSTHGNIGLLDISRVAFLKADGHYTQAYADGRYHFCRMSLRQLESRLPPDSFFRVHRSYVVNLAYASEVHRRDDQFVLTLGSGETERIPVSRGYVPRLRELLGV